MRVVSTTTAMWPAATGLAAAIATRAKKSTHDDMVEPAPRLWHHDVVLPQRLDLTLVFVHLFRSAFPVNLLVVSIVPLADKESKPWRRTYLCVEWGLHKAYANLNINLLFWRNVLAPA